MTKEPSWGWYASADEENYYCGPEPTRDAIIQAATGDEIGLYDLSDPQVFHIIEAWQVQVDLSDYFDAETFIEQVNDSVSDYGSETDEPIVDLSIVALSSLQTAVRSAISKWQADNNLRFRNWVFSGTRNAETITVPAPHGDTTNG
jgi:hypothetical protein